jgi:hypothetical protein
MAAENWQTGPPLSFGLASDIELLYFGLRKGLVGQDAWAGRASRERDMREHQSIYKKLHAVYMAASIARYASSAG